MKTKHRELDDGSHAAARDQDPLRVRVEISSQMSGVEAPS